MKMGDYHVSDFRFQLWFLAVLLILCGCGEDRPSGAEDMTEEELAAELKARREAHSSIGSTAPIKVDKWEQGEGDVSPDEGDASGDE